MKRLSLIAAALFLAIATLHVSRAAENKGSDGGGKSTETRMSPVEAAKLVKEGTAILIDVREPEEWKETGVAAPAVLLSKSDFDGERVGWERFLKANAGKELILYCRSGRRSGILAQELAAAGWKVANAGGLKDWTDAGLPTRKVEP
jgi:rhodanese-related sulfurtransferase